MVRLRAASITSITAAFFYFNSNMVRLREAKKMVNMIYQPNFNSNMVRLRVKTSDSAQEFQFQYGAIKSGVFNRRGKPLMQFQFQYGAIKRIFYSLIWLYLFYFNSNMVRLRDRANQCEYKLIVISIPIWCD